MNGVPHSYHSLAPQVKSFCKWLDERGAEVLEPTNEWEVVRFRANDQVSVIYKRLTNTLSWTGESMTAFRSYRNGGSWRGTTRKRRMSARATNRVKTLLKRDGPECFYCGREISSGEETLEHLVPLAKKGPDHLGNLFLSHAGCNQEAGHLSAAEKIKLRDRMRLDAWIVRGGYRTMAGDSTR